MLTLSTDIEKINRVGATTAKRLKKLGICNVRDLLFYFPFRYDDFSKVNTIENLRPGETANIVGQIELIQNKRSPRKRMNITEALVSDESETIKIIWFNQPFIARNLNVGDKVSLSGKVESEYGGLVMKSPNYEKLFNESGTHTQGLVPNYHLTANITQKQIRFLIKQIINLADKIDDWVPKEIIKNLKFLNLGNSIKKIHFPKSQDDIEKARERLAFNELFLMQLQSQIIKNDLKSRKSQIIKFKEKETKKFVDSLPFKLTDAQKKSTWEILKDIEKERPMTRLLEGDVGSGKTLVAVIAMLNTALNKKQAVLMVPTEILANQHYTSVNKMLKDFNIKISLLTRNHKKIEEDSQIIIGTHALIQENIEFNNLGLAIIDEQHRFGVEQRKKLISAGTPHLLSMTATPIPRSLALAMYGDLDLSIIDEMPKNRKKILTYIVPEKKRADGYKFIREEIKKGRQVFVICPLIDISDKLGVKSVKEEFEKLDKKVFPDLKIGFLHGKMLAKEKEKIMRDFLENKIKILVSTSVVEVGVDVPNATVMIIEGAERFGLAQLHQFRGRVGRGEHQSYCFLFSGSNSEKTKNRLDALTKNHNGLELAKIDLKQRGPGQVYGKEQKGFPELKVASLNDYKLMKQAQDQAIKLIKENGNLEKWPILKEKIDNYNKKIHLE